MEKIRLKDGTELNIESGATESLIAVVTKDLSIIDTYVKLLTKENLSHAVIVDENKTVVLTLKDKYLYNFDGTPIVDSEDYIVCFNIRDVYTFEERIAKLEAENEALKVSQEIQDEAIVELADIIAE